MNEEYLKQSIRDGRIVSLTPRTLKFEHEGVMTTITKKKKSKLFDELWEIASGKGEEE